MEQVMGVTMKTACNSALKINQQRWLVGKGDNGQQVIVTATLEVNLWISLH